MKHTAKLENMSRAPHTFPLCLTCWRKSEPLCRADRARFSSFPVVVGVWLGTRFCSLLARGHCFAECKTFEVSEAARPCSALKERSRSSGLVAAHEGPQIMFTYAARQTGSNAAALDLIIEFNELFPSAFTQVWSGDWRHVWLMNVNLLGPPEENCSCPHVWGAFWSPQMCRKSMPCFSEAVRLSLRCHL